MTPADDLSEFAAITAVAGLHAACGRYNQAHRDPIPELEEAALAVIEFVNQACSLDERLGGVEKPRTTYADARDLDDEGRVLPALRFARDRAMHQGVLPVTMIFVLGLSADLQPVSLRSAHVVWLDLTQMDEPTDGRQDTQDDLGMPHAGPCMRATTRDTPWLPPSDSSSGLSKLERSGFPTTSTRRRPPRPSAPSVASLFAGAESVTPRHRPGRPRISPPGRL